jgi:hypothetical protein
VELVDLGAPGDDALEQAARGRSRKATQDRGTDFHDPSRPAGGSRRISKKSSTLGNRHKLESGLVQERSPRLVLGESRRAAFQTGITPRPVGALRSQASLGDRPRPGLDNACHSCDPR